MGITLGITSFLGSLFSFKLVCTPPLLSAILAESAKHMAMEHAQKMTYWRSSIAMHNL